MEVITKSSQETCTTTQTQLMQHGSAAKLSKDIGSKATKTTLAHSKSRGRGSLAHKDLLK